MLLAHRAAVLSVRMEQAADRDLQQTAASAQAGREAFDADRASLIDGLITDLDAAADPASILTDLAATPDGMAYLLGAWEDLHAAIAGGDASALDRAALWLGRDRAAGESAGNLLRRIDAERARLEALANSPALVAATRQLQSARHQAGVLARFDPSPEAVLARRYEAAAERGMYRALKAIKDLRQGKPEEAALLLPDLSSFLPQVPSRSPVPPARPAPLGSFRAEGRASSTGTLPLAVGRPRPADGPSGTPRIGSDPRPTSPNRR